MTLFLHLDLYDYLRGVLSFPEIRGDLCAALYGIHSDLPGLFINGELDQSFDIVVYGDLTGDCVIDESDFAVVDLYNAWCLEDMDEFIESPYFIAGDINCDEAVDESDIAVIDLVNAWIGEIDQTDPSNFIFY